MADFRAEGGTAYCIHSLSSAWHRTLAFPFAGLAPEIVESTLSQIFAPYGKVVSQRICRDAQTRQSLGYGYVNFETVAQGEWREGREVRGAMERGRASLAPFPSPCSLSGRGGGKMALHTLLVQG